LEKTLGKLGFLDGKQKMKEVLFYRGRGCQQCDNTGYKGRIGIYEVLEVNEEISQLILQKATVEELEKAALKSGMMTVAQDGFIKAKNGITTIEEVLRVTKE
jgi:type II secretory ATPase GspE/PulE/Tfp pilus assembly ATPase PilB-like protein